MSTRLQQSEALANDRSGPPLWSGGWSDRILTCFFVWLVVKQYRHRSAKHHGLLGPLPNLGKEP